MQQQTVSAEADLQGSIETSSRVNDTLLTLSAGVEVVGAMSTPVGAVAVFFKASKMLAKHRVRRTMVESGPAEVWRELKGCVLFADSV